MAARELAAIALPFASLSLQPMVVASPLSAIVSVIGDPVLALASLSSEVKALHSGPESIIRSLITHPQEVQILSPRDVSS